MHSDLNCSAFADVALNDVERIFRPPGTSSSYERPSVCLIAQCVYFASSLACSRARPYSSFRRSLFATHLSISAVDRGLCFWPSECRECIDVAVRVAVGAAVSAAVRVEPLVQL